MNPIFYLIYTLLNLYGWVLIIYIILSWLLYFRVVNAYQPFVRKVNEVLHALVDPLLRLLRRFIPPVGGVDLSAIFAFVALEFLKYTIVYISR